MSCDVFDVIFRRMFHARESSYTPHVRRHFLAPVGFTEIPVGYARKSVLSSIVITSLAEEGDGRKCIQNLIKSDPKVAP